MGSVAGGSIWGFARGRYDDSGDWALLVSDLIRIWWSTSWTIGKGGHRIWFSGRWFYWSTLGHWEGFSVVGLGVSRWGSWACLWVWHGVGFSGGLDSKGECIVTLMSHLVFGFQPIIINCNLVSLLSLWVFNYSTIEWYLISWSMRFQLHHNLVPKAVGYSLVWIRCFRDMTYFVGTLNKWANMT